MRDNFLQQLICCPDCRGGLSDPGGQDAYWRCEGCQASFPVEEGIPLLFSREIQKDATYKTYSRQYQEHEEKSHERDLPIVGYLCMNTLERIKYHLLHGWPSLRLRKSAKKMEERFMSFARFIGPTEGLTVLDVGAGEALLLSLLKGNKVAFDLSPFYLRQAQERGSYGVAGFGERLPFKDNVFDLVVCSAVLEHVLRPETVAAEIVRVLKPKGRAIIETPFGEAEENLFEIQEDSRRLSKKNPLKPATRERPPTFHLRSFKEAKDLEALFPSLKPGKMESYFYKRRRNLPWWLKKLVRPMKGLPDPFKRNFPSLFAPSMCRMELVKV
jgi:SAM-dependent methyltransferase/uncharacterized protein YbaR (Trm112 family)